MICSLLTSYLSVRFTSERARTAWRILEYKGSSKMLRAIDSGSMTCSRTINAYQASLFLQQLSSWHSLTLCALYNFKILYIPQIVFVELRKVRQAFMLFKIQHEVLTFMACLLNHLTSESIRVVLCYATHHIQRSFSVPCLLWDSEHFAHLEFDYVQWMMRDK